MTNFLSATTRGSLLPSPLYPHDSNTNSMSRERLVCQVLGGQRHLESDTNNVYLQPPPVDKVIVLLWLYRDDHEVVQYLCGWLEFHVLKEPRKVDDIMEAYLPQLVQLALQWDLLGAEEAVESNTMERLLLIMAQLSTQFAVQYHWLLQSLLQDLQPENNGRRNDTFNMKAYGACMRCSGNLERCFRGNRKTRVSAPSVPKLNLVTTYGGAVTTNEKLVVGNQNETNREFFDTIVTLADENATRREQAECGTVTHLKQVFGGVLLYKRQLRKAGHRKQWKERYFAIEESMLNCYSRDRTLLRSMSLEAATIWKIPQDKHPHGFIVADEDGTMFHLRASCEEQKSLWKRKLREVIQRGCNNNNPLPENLTASQKDRYHTFQKAKWLGRTLIQTTLTLDGTPQEQRNEQLHDMFFEMEVPRDIHWPWEHLTKGMTTETNKTDLVVLPHFSNVIVDTNNPKALPMVEVSFMLRQTQEEAITKEVNFGAFLAQGRQDMQSPTSAVLPPILEKVLQDAPIHLQATTDSSFRTKDEGSTTGDSTGYVSMESDSEESSITGPSVSDVKSEDHKSQTTGLDKDTKNPETSSKESPEDIPSGKSQLRRGSSMENSPIELVLKAKLPKKDTFLGKVKRMTTRADTLEKNSVELITNQIKDDLHSQGNVQPPKETNSTHSSKNSSWFEKANSVSSDKTNEPQENSLDNDLTASWKLLRSQTMEKNPIELVLNLPKEHPLSKGRDINAEDSNEKDLSVVETSKAIPSPEETIKANLPKESHSSNEFSLAPSRKFLRSQTMENSPVELVLNLPKKHPLAEVDQCAEDTDNKKMIGGQDTNNGSPSMEKPISAKLTQEMPTFDKVNTSASCKLVRSQTMEKNPIELVLNLPKDHPLSGGKDFDVEETNREDLGLQDTDKVNASMEKPIKADRPKQGSKFDNVIMTRARKLLRSQTMENNPVELVLNLPEEHSLSTRRGVGVNEPDNVDVSKKKPIKLNLPQLQFVVGKTKLSKSRKLNSATNEESPIELVLNLPEEHPLSLRKCLDMSDSVSLSKEDSDVCKLQSSHSIEEKPTDLVAAPPVEHPISVGKNLVHEMNALFGSFHLAAPWSLRGLGKGVSWSGIARSEDMLNNNSTATLQPKEEEEEEQDEEAEKVAGANCTTLFETTDGIVSLRTKQYQWQEILAVQLAQCCKSMFSGTKIWIRPPQLQRLKWDIVLEVIPRQTISVADAKASMENGCKSLVDFFVAKHGPADSESFKKARLCFSQSLAGVYLLCYLLGLQSRHDESLLLDDQGHIFVSDFSCVFGKRINPISSSNPFKFSQEYIDLMGGTASRCYKGFCDLLVSGLLIIRNNAAMLVHLIQIAGESHLDRKSVERIVRQFEKKASLGASMMPKKALTTRPHSTKENAAILSANRPIQA